MKHYLHLTTTVFFSFLLLLSVNLLAENGDNGDNDVVPVSDILELREQEADNETVYLLESEAILLYQQSFRNKKWIQDETAGVEIDDNDGIITTQYALGDGITGIRGRLNLHNNNFQFVPVEDPGEPSSTGNEMTYVERTLDELSSADQGRLVKVTDVAFDEERHGETFRGGRSYDIADDSGEGTFRTEFREADYIDGPVPSEPVNIIAIVIMFHENVQITARSLADMGITDMHSIAALRNQAPDNETIYTLTNEAILTFQQDFRNNKYIEDGTAGILIDDNPGIITTEYEIYDGITGIEGKLSIFGNMMQFVPTEDPGAATSSGNEIVPPVITMETFVDDFMEYQGRLVTIENVSFVIDEENPDFANGRVYDFTDGETVAQFRTTFYDVNYIGDPIPAGELNITGLPNSRSDGNYLTSRHWGDIEALTYYAVTFELLDEDDEVLTDASVVLRGDTLTEGPYVFEEVPVGTHAFKAFKEGYHTTTGNVTVTDEDVSHTVILVAADPLMVTEFPMEEAFDGEDFPPPAWRHYSLGENGFWEEDETSALHNPFIDAESWLITPQIQLPEDESMLLIFNERNQLMADYGYSGVKISTGSGNPQHEQFVELYESDENIGIADPKETMIDLTSYAGQVVYLAFVYKGDNAHRWWIDDLSVDVAPEAIEVPDIATLLQQDMGDLIYRITGEVIITHLQTDYRGQFYIQDDTGALLIDDAPGVIETSYDLYDGITNLTGNLGAFQNMMQLLPTEDPGEASSQNNEVEPLEITLADLTENHQGLLVMVRNVRFHEDSPETFVHNESYDIYDDTGEGLIRTPNHAGLLDYFGQPVPDTPKDLIAVVHQRFEVSRIQPRMLADFMDPDDTAIPVTDDPVFRLYPNPATTHFFLENKGKQIDKVRVYHLSGQLVMEETGVSSELIQLNTHGLRPGMYIVRIITGNEIQSLKLQINR